ncbi:hypothetical protein [Azospirillum rugosum]|uniref:Uncharacterized protein n=1 Tax=Azospirillum rugosum TaxID=416170 RepID=A0ABS4SP14_9PROT|nr:hypothetical protein [Azospirillum rugosum]MBP2294290.1 hypothetical protein [Azospirillum rugosum]MDQ0527625.1 hypothetical protein [Azospirillum rugosum]
MNRLWTGVLFVTVVLTAALIARLLGWDPLRLKRAPAAATYWIDRSSSRTAADTMARLH